MKWLLNLVRSEPVLTAAVFDALFIVLAKYGLPITPDQRVALDGLVIAVTAWIARSQVAPTIKLSSP